MRRTARIAALVTGALVVGASLSAHADPRPSSTGLFTEFGVGPALFIQDAGSYVAPGPAIDLRAGYEPFTWLAVGAFLGISNHRATVPPPPVREYFQLYQAGVDLRLAYSFGAVGVFVDGRVGGGVISSNVLEKVGILEPAQRFSYSYAAGAGLEYQLENRHYALGLAGQWMAYTDFTPPEGPMGGVTTRLYLRYTYE
ncbi:hypothetical protein [Haliangium ochraceum]|uniref:Outer membrane protein beta-barrel domain-containing protein n=1 Tax=Haliangium ochraceum (strain DSM 14365 / JCM 11303 / SMP-2) TaxID=502025 RepID=D0LI86_HALO1|nr:hypothetical protein [Haliangium ochraceum]ACY16465.1 hypothetical protein Hoch_3966 [Haliangium ochraceum DSM 14365]